MQLSPTGRSELVTNSRRRFLRPYGQLAEVPPVSGDDQQRPAGGQSEACKRGSHAAPYGNDRDDHQQPPCDRSEQEAKLGKPNSSVTSDGDQEHENPVSRTIRTASGAAAARAYGRPAVPNLTN